MDIETHVSKILKEPNIRQSTPLYKLFPETEPFYGDIYNALYKSPKSKLKEKTPQKIKAKVKRNLNRSFNETPNSNNENSPHLNYSVVSESEDDVPLVLRLRLSKNQPYVDLKQSNEVLDKLASLPVTPQFSRTIKKTRRISFAVENSTICASAKNVESARKSSRIVERKSYAELLSPEKILRDNFFTVKYSDYEQSSLKQYDNLIQSAGKRSRSKSVDSSQYDFHKTKLHNTIAAPSPKKRLRPRRASVSQRSYKEVFTDDVQDFYGSDTPFLSPVKRTRSKRNIKIPTRYIDSSDDEIIYGVKELAMSDDENEKIISLLSPKKKLKSIVRNGEQVNYIVNVDESQNPEQEKNEKCSRYYSDRWRTPVKIPPSCDKKSIKLDSPIDHDSASLSEIQSPTIISASVDRWRFHHYTPRSSNKNTYKTNSPIQYKSPSKDKETKQIPKTPTYSSKTTRLDKSTKLCSPSNISSTACKTDSSILYNSPSKDKETKQIPKTPSHASKTARLNKSPKLSSPANISRTVCKIDSPILYKSPSKDKETKQIPRTPSHGSTTARLGGTPKLSYPANTISKHNTVSQNLRLMRAGVLTPTVQSRVTAVKSASTPLNKTRIALHVAHVPDALPCRETEAADIYGFVEGKLLDGCGGCMYISGVPGTGKTATVTYVIRQLQDQSRNGELPKFDYVSVNGMRLTEPRQSYVEILKQLNGKIVPWEQAQNQLNTKFTKKGQSSKPIVLLIDELDILCTKRQDVVYNLLDWPSKAYCQLIVVTIANTMDLPERLLMGRVTSRLGLTRLTFQAYNHKQLQEIVTKRLIDTQTFNPDAIQLVARKVASVSGDARRALDICRRAAEMAEAHNKNALVSMAHVNEALESMMTQPKIRAIKSSSRLQKLLLQSIVAEIERTGVEETSFSAVFTILTSLAAIDGFAMVSMTIAMAAIAKLGSCRLLLLDQKNSGLYQRIMLNVSVDDVYYALKSE